MRFDSYHPMINLIYFSAAIICTILFDHPVFLIISYVSAFVYSVFLNGKRSLILNICMILFMGIYTAWYSYYNHFGITNIRMNFIGNHITLEAVVTGMVRGVTISSVIMLCSCLFAVMSTDKVIYLFGRISPKLSLFLAVLLRFVPRIGIRAGRIERSREGIGKGCIQGNFWQKIVHGCSFLSILITWTLEDFVESAASMKCRGYSLRGRTAFSIYRFDNRDRVFVLAQFSCMTMIFMGIALNQTTIQYDPEIIMNRITPASWLFYMAYAVFLLMPLILQLIGEWRFQKQQTENFADL